MVEAIALEHWPRDGIPARPAAWLTTTARRTAIDRLRHEAMRDRKQDELALLAELEGHATADEEHDIADERLRLISPAAIPRSPRTPRLRSRCERFAA